MTDREQLIGLTLANDLACQTWSTWSPTAKAMQPLADAWSTQGDYLGRNLRTFGNAEQRTEMGRLLDEFWARGGRTLNLASREYPSQLRAIAFPPLVLHTQGDLELLQTGLGIVGTRHPSNELEQKVVNCVRMATGAGLPIITGMARGIDSLAATTALANGGSVIGVLPGTDASDWEAPKDGQVLITETLAKSGPQKSAYLRRNRIISGIARLVVGFGIRGEGGTFNQLQWAQRQGRPFVVLAEGAAQGFRRDVPQPRFAYHFVSADRLMEKASDLWVTPSASSQAILA